MEDKIKGSSFLVFLRNLVLGVFPLFSNLFEGGVCCFVYDNLGLIRVSLIVSRVFRLMKMQDIELEEGEAYFLQDDDDENVDPDRDFSYIVSAYRICVCL